MIDFENMTLQGALFMGAWLMGVALLVEWLAG